jgi:hypothetical protein
VFMICFHPITSTSTSHEHGFCAKKHTTPRKTGNHPRQEDQLCHRESNTSPS